MTTFPGSVFSLNSINPCSLADTSGIEKAQCAWTQVQQLLAEEADPEESYTTVGPALVQFSKIAQDVMSRTASNYNVSRLALGLLITVAASLIVLPATYQACTRNASSGLFLIIMVITYGMMMFASSYVEEEQQFWYWICSGWTLYLHIKSESANPIPRRSSASLVSWSGRYLTLVLAITQRVLRRWNQTGQKFAAEPDIARTFFAHHPMVFWGLLILTYMDAGHHLVSNVPISGILRAGTLVPVMLAFTFKLHFVASESPELLDQTIILQIMQKWPYSLSLVLHARLVFYGLAAVILLVLLVRKQPGKARGKFTHILTFSCLRLLTRDS